VIVNETRQARPPLATIICTYLIVTALVPLPLIWIYLLGWFNSLSEGSESTFIFHPTLPHSPLYWVSCALAIAGAIALWQMRRLAFSLLATRLGLSLITRIITLPRGIALFRITATMPPGIADSSALRTTYLLIVAQWIISALIVWYVYRITSPKPFVSGSAKYELHT
jgi:hypothetical protein